MYKTLLDCAANLNDVKDQIRDRQAARPKRPGAQPERDLLCDLVADKGYHSRDVCEVLSASGMSVRSYLSEPDCGR